MKNDYEIRKEVTAIFLKSKDGILLETLIDTEDLDKMKEYPNVWYAYYSKFTRTHYVRGIVTLHNKDGAKQREIHLHRLIKKHFKSAKSRPYKSRHIG